MPLDSITFSGVMQFINAVGVIAVGIYTWLISRSVANREAIDRQAAHQAEADRRIDRLESVADHAPTHQDLAELHSRINDLSGAVRELVGVMGAVQRSLDRVETKLMQEAK